MHTLKMIFVLLLVFALINGASLVLFGFIQWNIDVREWHWGFRSAAIATGLGATYSFIKYCIEYEANRKGE